VLVVRGMAFYLDSDPSQANPTLTVRAGERVRVVLRNEERGFTHDFAVPAIEAATDLINWNEQSSVTFDVPDRPGTYEYVCEPHAMMMRGRIIVQ
jgi:plastocyanin